MSQEEREPPSENLHSELQQNSDNLLANQLAELSLNEAGEIST
jgi:hypothetical protein